MTRLIWLVAVLCCVLSRAHAQGQGPDEQYVRIYQLIQDADRLGDSGQTRAAAAKYIEAQEALMRFRGVFPGWNERVVNYRLNYVATKLAPLTSQIVAPGKPPETNVPSASVTLTPLPPATNLLAIPAPAAPAAPAVSTAPTIPAPPMSVEYDNQIKALQTEVERLQAETRSLSAKLKEALSVQPAGIDPREMAKAEERIRSLLKENELYKVQMAQRPAAATVSPNLALRMAEQTELITTLRTENEVLKRQAGEMNQKYDALAAVAAQPKPDPQKDAVLQKLSINNTALQKEVELWKQVARKPPQPPPPAEVVSVMPPEAQRELEGLRARLQVFEAKPVPYTAEELALFQKPQPMLAEAAAAPAANTAPVLTAAFAAEAPRRKGTRGVPSGAGILVRAAERAFATLRYAEAEQKYQEVLRQDENNVTTLGNLASAQLELANIAEAEKTALRALALDPDDYFSLYVLGRIRFRQDRLDEALDVLSRSAKANPNYADTQNYLGIVLSEKGQRLPAEAALRRAIQLQPDNAVAHNNLAVVYATQKPPALALARWHYQKAIAGGHPKNADLEKMMAQ